MREKRERIFRAAAELIAERGFEAVTTQEISERADVAAGTLFRYASSKGELLLMVYNAAFEAALDVGEMRAAELSDPVDAIVGLMAPTIEHARTNGGNSIAYQRELLFGPSDEQYRSEGLELVARLEAAVAKVLILQAEAGGIVADDEAALLAARAIFAAMHLAIAGLSIQAHAGRDVVGGLRRQVAQIVAGFLAVARDAAQE